MRFTQAPWKTELFTELLFQLIKINKYHENKNQRIKKKEEKKKMPKEKKAKGRQKRNNINSPSRNNHRINHLSRSKLVPNKRLRRRNKQSNQSSKNE